MKRILSCLVALSLVLSFAVCVSFAQTDRVTLEKNKLKGDIARLEKDRMNAPSNKGGKEWFDTVIAAKKQSLQELESNPEQYFYNKEQNAPVGYVDTKEGRLPVYKK